MITLRFNCFSIWKNHRFDFVNVLIASEKYAIFLLAEIGK